MAQSLKLETYGVSPRMITYDLVDDFFEYPYSGLTSVGVGTMVYLKVSTAESFTNPVWTMPVSPAGSQTTLNNTLAEGDNVIYLKFTPDKTGRYVIEFGDNGVTADITFNSAMYLGVDGGPVSCMNCHNNSLYGFIETSGEEQVTIQIRKELLMVNSVHISAPVVCNVILPGMMQIQQQ
ncbi:MAG TPA: hypothetical protein ENN33_11345 [Ignavibacteria bacterium]|nr:hypothetical protein [Ignavibacteria bacterium]